MIPETEEEFQLILNPEVKRFADEVSQIPSFAKLGGKEQEKLLGDLRYTIREGDKPTSPLLAALVGGATTGGGLATFRGLQFFVVFNGERALGYLLEEAKWYGGAAVVGALLAGLGMDAYHKMNSGVEKRNILEAYLTQIDDAKKAHFHQLESAFAHCLYQNPDAIDTEKLALALANEKFHDILFEDGMAWHFADMIDHYEQMNLEPLPLINDRGPAEEKRRAKNRVQCGDQLAEIKKTLLGAPAESADVVAAL
ncbi:MAG: hypothetical protein HYU99_01570 [Deltaproteobacteria bacterium]|nr:hypothetical protein [Deltaproteobacteria bacterium]